MPCGFWLFTGNVLQKTAPDRVDLNAFDLLGAWASRRSALKRHKALKTLSRRHGRYSWHQVEQLCAITHIFTTFCDNRRTFAMDPS